jgi:hypothetical protein
MHTISYELKPKLPETASELLQHRLNAIKRSIRNHSAKNTEERQLAECIALIMAKKGAASKDRESNRRTRSSPAPAGTAETAPH